MNYLSKNSRRAALALTLATLFSLNALPGYSSTYSTRNPFKNSQVAPQPDGLDITPVLDTGRAVSQLITRTEGGTLSSTGVDGTRFALNVPADSLFEDEVITMTPVVSVTGLPFSRGVAAVQLEPEGLVLKHAATLTFETAGEAPVDEEAPCAWDGDGSDFHLYPLDADLSHHVMPLIHFSGYGLGRGTSAEIVAQQQRSPISYRSNLEQHLQTLTGNERIQRAESGGTTRKQQKKFWKKVDNTALGDIEGVTSLLGEALKSTEQSQLRCALSRSLYLLASIELTLYLTRETSPVPLLERLSQVLDLIETALKTLSDRAWERCSDDASAQVLILLGCEREATRLAAKHPAFVPLANDIRRKARECGQFELEVDSTVEGFTDHTAISAQVKTTVRLQLSLDDSTSIRVTGSAALEYAKLVVNFGIPCSISSQGYGTSPFIVKNLVLNFGLDDPCGAESSTKLPALRMEIDPGKTTEHVSASCAGGASANQDYPSPGFWGGGFAYANGMSPSGVIVIDNWKRGSGNVIAFAESHKQKDAPDGTIISEISTYKIRHK